MSKINLNPGDSIVTKNQNGMRGIPVDARTQVQYYKDIQNIEYAYENLQVIVTDDDPTDAKHPKGIYVVTKLDANNDVDPSGIKSLKETVNVTKQDIGLENVDNVKQVPQTRTINNKPLNSDITLNSNDVGAIPTTEKGANNGVAELDSSGKLKSTQIPSEVATNTSLGTKVDKVSGAEGKLPKFNNSGNLEDSGFSIPTTEDSDQILGYDSTLPGKLKWINKPVNGQNGDSAYQIWLNNNQHQSTDPGYSETDFLNSLKAHIGNFHYENTDADVVSHITDIGDAVSGINNLVPGDGNNGTDDTLDVIVLMNNGDTTTPKTMMFSTSGDSTNGYKFYYVGDLQSAMPSNVLTDDDIDNDFAGGNDKVASADEVKNLNAQVNGAEIDLFQVGTYGSWHDTRYLAYDSGNVNTSTVNSVTDFIDVSKFQQIKTIINKAVTPESAACVCFYDENETYLNTAILPTVGGTERSYEDIIADIPNNCKFVRFTCYTAEKDNWYLTGVIKEKDYLTTNIVGASINYLNTNNLISGYRNSNNGGIVNDAEYRYSSPIYVSRGTKIILNNAAISTAVAFLTKVSSTGEVISIVKVGESTNSELHNYEVLIDFDGYISLSCRKFNALSILIITSAIYDKINLLLTPIDNRVSEVEEDLEDVKSIIQPSAKELEPSDVTVGNYRNINGNLSNGPAYIYSTPIFVKDKTRIITTEEIAVSTAVSLISKVNSDNSYIETLVAGTGSDNPIQCNYTVQGDCYIGLSCLETQYTKLRIIEPGINEQIQSLSSNSIGVDSTTRLIENSDNPLSVIIRECGYGCLIKTWGFIGDSYTSGETPAYEGSSQKILDCYKWSWGQQFMKIIGSEGYNFSNGGQTAKGWIRSQGTVHDDSYYGGVGGGDWRQAQIDLKQGYIISLGINDRGAINNGTYLNQPYSLGDVTTDVNVSDYTQNNENTFAGCYAGIVQRLLSVQPKAKIFCITQFQDDLENINDVVRDIVALFPNNVFLIDLHDYALNIVDEQYYMKNGHPTPLGYAYMAACINTYVDYIIRNNKQKFMDVTLIGSNYSLNSN